jgi:hypothetical protein
VNVSVYSVCRTHEGAAVTRRRPLSDSSLPVSSRTRKVRLALAALRMSINFFVKFRVAMVGNVLCPCVWVLVGWCRSHTMRSFF